MSMRKYEVAKWWRMGAAYGFLGCSNVPDAPKDSMSLLALRDGWRWARSMPDTDALNAFLHDEGMETLHMISPDDLPPASRNIANASGEGREV